MMNPLTRLEPGQPALVTEVSAKPDPDGDGDEIHAVDDDVETAESDPPRRVVVDLMQSGQMTFASVDDEPLPPEWRDTTALELTYLDRSGVYTMDVPVVTCGTTRLVVSGPEASSRVVRRAYARVFTPLSATCLLLDPEANRFTQFDATVHDMGGGGLALSAPDPNRPLALVVSDGEALDARSAPTLAPDGATLVVSVALPREAPVVVVGKVLPRDGGRLRERLIRVEFALIREADRDRILRFVLLTLAGVYPAAHG